MQRMLPDSEVESLVVSIASADSTRRVLHPGSIKLTGLSDLLLFKLLSVLNVSSISAV